MINEPTPEQVEEMVRRYPWLRDPHGFQLRPPLEQAKGIPNLGRRPEKQQSLPERSRTMQPARQK